MRIIILGAGAGGGMPQWNGNSGLNRKAFAGDAAVPRLTQCGLAVSADDTNWVLFNASPDLRQQVIATPALHPKGPEQRHSPISAVFLTSADVDAVAGLLTLREGHAFDLYATPYVQGALAENPIFNVLAPERVQRWAMEPDTIIKTAGLHVMALLLKGKPPLYNEARDGIEPNVFADTTCGYLITETKDGEPGKRVLFLPACAELDRGLMTMAITSDLLLFDGTLYTDDEMITQGAGRKTSRRMGHLPMAGPDGSLAQFKTFPIERKVYVHINNTNPVLERGSKERRMVEYEGWEIGEDGMEFVL